MRPKASLAAAGTLGLALILTACGPAASPAADPASPPGTASTAPPGTQAAPPSGSPNASPTPAPDWTSYTTADGSLTFEHPADWTVTDPAGQAAPGGVFVGVADEHGTELVTLRTNMVTGSECLDKYPYSVLDSVPLPALAQQGEAPRFVFETRTDVNNPDPAKVNVHAYGITSAMAPDGPEACPIFHFFTWPPNGAMFGGAYNPLAARPGLEMHVDSPEAYTETAEYKKIKKMITSLRPAS